MIEKVIELPAKMWEKIASYSIGEIRRRTDAGRGVRDNGKEYSFPPYTEEYAEAKKKGFKRKTNRSGNRGTKYKSLSQQSTDRQTNPPNFSARTLTMKDLNVLYRGKGFITIGWRGEFGMIVDAHDDLGKYQVGNMSDKELEKILKIIADQMDDNWNRKVKDVSIRL